MKITVYGKIISRTQRNVKSRSGGDFTLYSIELEEPGQYPSIFKLSTKDASIFGQADGPFAVGKMASATAFANGRRLTTYKDKDGVEHQLKIPRCDVYFNLTQLTPAEAPAAPAAPADDLDDMPY